LETAIERPRFRNDLVAQPIEEEGVRFVDVTDPNSGMTERFYDVEYSIACAMDGQRSIDALAQWTFAELGIETSAEELSNVVNTLADLGYLEGEEAVPGPGPGIDRDVAQAYDQAMELGPPGRSVLEERPVTPPPVEPFELGAPGAPLGGDASERRRFEAEKAAQELEELDLDEMEKEHRAATAPPPPPIELRPKGEPVKKEAETSFAGLLDEEAEAAAAAEAEKTPEPVSIEDEQPREVAMEADEPPHPLDDEDPTKIPRPMMAPPDEEPDEEDLRVDLSAHLKLGREEVKEAVRSSRVHTVPEIPRELRDDADAATTPIITRAGPPPPVPAELPEDQRAMSVASIAPLTPSQATPLPERPPLARATRPLAPIEPSRVQPAIRAPERRRSSMGLWVVLALLLIGAGAVYVFKDQIFGSDGFSSRPATPTHEVPSAPPKPPETTAPTEPKPEATPPAPAPPAAALPAAAVREETGGGGEVKAPAEGLIAWVAPEGTAVAAGAPVAKYQGYKKEEARVLEGQQRGEYYAKVLAEAEKTTDEDKIGMARAKVDEKKRMVEEAAAALDKLVVKAPAAGNVAKATKPRPVKAGDPLVEMNGGGKVLRATFDAGDAASRYRPGQNVSVAPKAAPDKETPAVVDAVDGSNVTVRLGGGAAAGDEIVLLPPK